MFNSKPIKIDLDYKEPNLFIKFFRDKLFYPIVSFYYRYSEAMARAVAFARIGWSNYDFDFIYLYKLIEFKLDRIEKCLIRGHVINEPEDLAALAEAKSLCSRLVEEDFESIYLEKHYEKWGEPEFRSEPLPDGFHSFLVFHKNAVTEEEKDLETKERIAIYRKAEADRLATHDRLNEIFKKHGPTWWD